MELLKEFNFEAVVSKALLVFRRFGFHGTSFDALTDATGINKGFLQRSFRSKEELFLLCMDQYILDARSMFFNGSGSAATYLRNFFKGIIERDSEDKAMGCLILNTCGEFAKEDFASKRSALIFLDEVQDNFYEVLAYGQAAREFDRSLNAEKLSQRLLALEVSLMSLGKLNRSDDFLRNIANATLKEIEISL